VQLLCHPTTAAFCQQLLHRTASTNAVAVLTGRSRYLAKCTGATASVHRAAAGINFFRDEAGRLISEKIENLFLGPYVFQI
jgi:hypothetical protein